MVKSLRRKFVLITMLYLLSVVAVLFIADGLYSSYLDDLNTRSLLEWVVSSNLLYDTDKKIDEELGFQEIEEQENPIIGLIVDPDGNVTYRRYIGDNKSDELPEDVIRTILCMPADRYKAGNFVFTRKMLKNGDMLIVLMDTSFHEENVSKRVYTALIIMGAIFILLLITVALSYYVTEPARKAFEREKQFISDASHELKTPLGAIGANVQALDLDKKNGIYINNIISEINRMNRLIERLLTLSRLEESGKVDETAFSLSEIMEEMLLTYESAAFERKIVLNRIIQEDVRMKGDEDEIRQLIVILLDNAMKNAGENGSIDVSVFNNKEGIHIVLKNTGKIIKETDLEHVFDRFYTTDLSRHGGSFGLGLAIARAIVSRHNGTISATSSEEEGTVFLVCFKGA
ncbi:MAG: HAMP domain-containing histidine kinase [Lachnospiraceae bacterium]|nr:HAMP domain-containing histidine kinase [Lachnospiraceae bacterium]